jgi:hypothetical protein
LWDWFAFQQVPDRDVAHDDPTLGKFVCECPDRDIRLIREPAHQPVALGFEDRPAMTADLAGREAAGRTIAAHQLDCSRHTHIKPSRS